FAAEPAEQDELKHELQNYLAQEILLETLVPELQGEGDRRQVLKLSYEIIRSNTINEYESQVYQKLLGLLQLPEEEVKTVEAEVEAGMSNLSLDEYLQQ
ncbi:MAG: urea ABC transporter ATP-binding protein UrtD, partial [Spirulinaceae cyanobacterium]